MKKIALITLLLAMTLLFVACGGGKYTYADDGHQHVYGNRYDVVTPSCTQAGSFVRYCKICQEPQVTELAKDESKHVLTETTVAPTETQAGSYVRSCSLCKKEIENRVLPALYVLFSDENTLTTMPAGVSGMLLSDTVSHRIARVGGAAKAVDIDIVRRLAVALVVSEAIGEGELAADARFLVTPAFAANLPSLGVASSDFRLGDSYTVQELLAKVLRNGKSDAVAALAELLDETDAAFTARVNARLCGELGLSGTVFATVIKSSIVNQTTVKDTSTLFARVLDDSLVLTLLAAQVPAGTVIGSVTPTVYLVGEGMRLSAIPDGTGGLRFLVLCGTALPANLESTIY